MSYQCCNCPNFLDPQGPVIALMAQHDAPDMDMGFTKVRLTSSALFDIASLRLFASKSKADQVLSITSEKIRGTAGDFSLHALVNMKGDHSVTQYIIICCSACGKSCQFEEEYL